MNANAPLHISGYEQLQKLRMALAIARCTKLLSTLQQEAESTVSHDQAKRVTYLTELFSRIHRDMFHDWKEQATASHRPGAMTAAEKRKAFREAIERLVLDGDGVGNGDTAIFDNNGFVMKIDNIAERLAHFYRTMRAVRPFAYGNRLVLDVFLSTLGGLPAFKAVYEPGIDFRRLEAGDAAALHDPASSREAVTLAFQHAMAPTRNKDLENRPNGYGKWPENKKFISGIPFLSHRTEDGVECLVTVNGGLAPLDQINADIIVSGKHFADFAVDLSDKIVGYLPDTESLRAPGKNEIDGIRIGPGGYAPLFCLDVNMMTGLRAPSHTELVELLHETAGTTQISHLANNERLKAKLLAVADGDPRLARTVEIAYERLARMTAKLERCRQAIFEGKTPAPHPSLFMCMGGAGSGKTAVEEIAQARCGDNFVVASLDAFRRESDLYQVLTAANHHSDDYIFVEPFANRLRDIVANHARENRINLLYDGTGIPYKPRYSSIVNAFKKAGFRTQMAAVDAFIVKPEGREHELSRSAVIDSVKLRFQETGRALPWVVTVDKHIRAPSSFLDALEHAALDKLSLFANDGERDKHYLVAESFDFTDEEALALQEEQMAGRLAGCMKMMIRRHEHSVLKNLAAGSEDKLRELLQRIPLFDETNVAYQVYASDAGNRALLIYNAGRMVDFVEKRQLNPNASGEEGLLHKPVTLAFHVDPKSKAPWRIRLRGSLFKQ
jgi:hypothetical protein